MVAPAAGFYGTEGLGKDEIRISYCLNTAALEDAMNILGEAIIEYNKTHK